MAQLNTFHPLNQEIRKRHYHCIGHTLRKSASSAIRRSFYWKPQSKRNITRHTHMEKKLENGGEMRTLKEL